MKTTAAQKKAISALTATFGTSSFLFDFRWENAYAHPAGSIVISRKVFQALVDGGLVAHVDSFHYRVA